MFRRLVIQGALTCAVAIAASVLVASPASAWSNGVDGPNTYGTHDWILDHALDGWVSAPAGSAGAWRFGRPTIRTP